MDENVEQTHVKKCPICGAKNRLLWGAWDVRYRSQKLDDYEYKDKLKEWTVPAGVRCSNCQDDLENDLRRKAYREFVEEEEDEKRKSQQKEKYKSFQEAGKLGNNLDEITRLKLQAIFFTQ
jgi:hypothetical protein